MKGKFREKLSKVTFIVITGQIIVEAFDMLKNIVESNVRNVAIIVKAALPYLMWYLGASLYEERGEFAVGGEVFIPLIVFIITYYLSQYANHIGKGEKIPVPKKRFTQSGDDDGEVVVETSRTEEMILYLADLEDWLERKGLLRK